MAIAILLIGIICFIVGSAGIHLGTSVAGITPRSYGKALVTSAVGWSVGAVLGGFLSILGADQTRIGFLIAVGVHLAIVKSIYGTTWGKALVTWIIETLTLLIFVAIPLIVLALVAGVTMGLANH